MAPSYRLDETMRAAIAAAIADVAPSYGLDPVLVQALSNRELADGRLISAPNANGSRDYGPLQVNAGTLQKMKGEWATLDPHDLVTNPVLGVKAGLIIFRWRVYEALAAHSIYVPYLESRPGYPNYDEQGRILTRLSPTLYRAVLYHALAGYNDGDRGIKDWPNLDPEVLVYVGKVWLEYERLQGGVASRCYRI